MPSACSTSTKLSLPNFLQSLFYSEFALQLRPLSTRPVNRLTLPRHNLTSRRTITTVSLDSIPVTSVRQTPTPAKNEPSPNIDSSNAANQNLNGQTTQATAASRASTASSPPTHQRKTKPKKPSGRQTGNQNTKTSAQKDQTNTGAQPKKKREGWQIQKDALQRNFPNGWSPPKKLSPDAIEGIRHLNSVSPERFTTAVLAGEFKVSPEAIRRILKSKWRPSAADMENRRKRWENRHERIWSHMSELGLRPKRPESDSVSDAAAILYNQNKKSKSSSDPL